MDKDLDILIIPHGTLVGFVPCTDAGREWINEMVESEAWQWMGHTLWVDHGFAGAVIEGAGEDGLVVGEEA